VYRKTPKRKFESSRTCWLGTCRTQEKTPPPPYSRGYGNPISHKITRKGLTSLILWLSLESQNSMYLPLPRRKPGLLSFWNQIFWSSPESRPKNQLRWWHDDDSIFIIGSVVCSILYMFSSVVKTQRLKDSYVTGNLQKNRVLLRTKTTSLIKYTYRSLLECQ